jgi:hypothetical protein
MSETIVRRAGEESITPFWRRIPRFFLYPLSPQPLLFMVGLACVTLVARSIPVLAIAVVVLTAIAFLRYCYFVLDRAAFGQGSTTCLVTSQYDEYRPWKQLAVLLLYGVLVGLAAWVFGEVSGYVVQYALLLLLPANVMWSEASAPARGRLRAAGEACCHDLQPAAGPLRLSEALAFAEQSRR